MNYWQHLDKEFEGALNDKYEEIVNLCKGFSEDGSKKHNLLMRIGSLIREYESIEEEWLTPI